MLEPTQTLLIAVITTLTILLTIIGVQVVQILKELKKTAEKINQILDKSEKIVNSVVEPLEGASGFVSGLKKGVNFLNLVAHFLKSKKEKHHQDE